MGTCCSVPSVEEAESAQQFRALDANKNNLACREEMAQYVASRAELWAMLSVNLGLSETECRATATRVAMELASGKQGSAAQTAEVTEAEFHTFRAKYILNGKGAQEFFHRCVFATFDADGNDALDPDEVDQFLDTFYKSGSIFEGDSRLPPRDALKQQLLKNANADGTLQFHQIRSVIQGTMGGGGGSSIVTDQENSACFVPAFPTEATPKQPEQTPEPVQVPPSPANSKKGSPMDPEETPEVRPKSKKNVNKSLNTSTHSHTSHTDDSPQGKPRKRRKPKAKTPVEQLQDDSNKSSASEKQKPRKSRAKKPSSSASDPRSAQYDTDDTGNIGNNGEGKPRPRRTKKIGRNNSNLSQASSGPPSAGSDCENKDNNNVQASRPPRSQRKKKIRRNTSNLSQDSASSPAQPSGGSDYDDSNGQTTARAPRSQRKKTIRRSNSNLSQDSGHRDKPRKPRPKKRQEDNANQEQ